MENEKIKHLEFIQNIITRMNTNSFQIKGWTITIISAILALFASTGKICFILISVFPAVVFWFLDTFYLLQERKFRKLYEEIIETNKIKSFSMKEIKLYHKGTINYFKIFFSKTIFYLYFPLIIFLILIYLYFYNF